VKANPLHLGLAASDQFEGVLVASRSADGLHGGPIARAGVAKPASRATCPWCLVVSPSTAKTGSLSWERSRSESPRAGSPLPPRQRRPPQGFGLARHGRDHARTSIHL